MGCIVKLMGFIVVGTIILVLFAAAPDAMLVAVGLACVGWVSTHLLGK